MNDAAPARSGSKVGALAGLAAAALFGLSAPIGKWLVGDVDPQLLAGLLYAGAAIGFWIVRFVRGVPAHEAPLARKDVPSIAAVALLGGAVAPVLLLVGLARVSGVVGSLLLNLEAVATIALAGLVFREHVGSRVLLAGALVVAGAVMLGLGPGDVALDPIGVAAIALACLAWGVDNNLTQRLTAKDPFAIVRIKATSAGAANVAIAVARGVSWPSASIVAIALVVGFFAYGVSVLLDAYALRLVGAAREAAYFATGPFFGALAAVALFRESIGLGDALALFAMMGGVVLLVREKHQHRHHHEVMEHEHVHEHDEHHDHEHEDGVVITGRHSHSHRHEALDHDHAHVPDQHHRHRH